MNFADSLRNYNADEENTQKLQAGKANAIRVMVDTTQKAIEYSARQASLCGKRKVSGYVTITNNYDANSFYSLKEEWGYNRTDCQNVGIYQIDLLKESSFFPSRLTKEYNSGALYVNACKLTKNDMDTLCNEVAEMIRTLGFYDYRVEAVPMHFYRLLHEKRRGFFGSKWITEKIDDGIGHVLKVTISW